MKERLDRMAKTLRRSRSSLMIEALERHLDDIQSQQADQQSKGRFTNIMKFKGAGAAITGGSSSSDIDASIRNFRGDE
jgi:predicted transcriptional regulator